MNDSINKAFVIGAGQMGLGIAQVMAQHGLQVQLYDSFSGQLERAKSSITLSLSKLVEKEKITDEQKSSTLNNLEFLEVLPKKIEGDLLVEAIVENIDLKRELFSEISGRVKEEAILASNTSSLSITKIAATVKRPDRFIGMHFMNPVPLMELIEIIRGLQTSQKTYEEIVALTKRLNKTPITALKDQPGFIVNRILVPMINEAFFTLMEGVATPEDIDLAMKLGTNQPMGPLALADFVGLDTCLFICETFHRELGEDKYRPCPLLRKYVEAGWVGRKVKRGVYTY